VSQGAATRPVPYPTALTAPHWDACARGVLLVQRCSVCSAYVFPPEPNCTRCLSPDLAWVESDGTGTVHTYSVVWRPQQPAFDAPYVVVVVELDEGWHMMSNVVGCDPTDVSVGMRVAVDFQPVDGVTLPVFRPHD
jgi:uncharacterized OB-fold protein